MALLLAGVVAVASARSRRTRLASAALALAGLAAAGGRIVPEYLRPIAKAPPGPRDLTIVTANVWRDNVDPAGTIATLRASGADLLLLQETDGRMAPWLAGLARTYPYRSHCWVRCSLTILSRRPFLRERFRLRDAANRKYGPDLAWSRLIAPDGMPVTVATLHYVWPIPGRGQARTRAALARALETIDRRDLILAGDMNLTPWSVAMRRQDAALGPLVRQTRALFSWPARVGGGRAWPLPLLPIDQLYAGPQWRQVEVRTLPRTGSDHDAVFVRLRRN